MKSLPKISIIIFLLAFPLLSLLYLGSTVDSQLTFPSFMEIAKVHPVSADTSIPHIETLPDFSGVTNWIGDGFSKHNAAGKVVLVYFWNMGCAECLQNVSNFKEIQSTFREFGFEMVSIHTPEFDGQENAGAVKNVASDYGISYRVGVDNQFTVWNSFNNRFWPAIYLFNRKGELVYTHFGNLRYADLRQEIMSALQITEQDLIKEEDEETAQSPGTFFGYKKTKKDGGRTRYGGTGHLVMDNPVIYSYNNNLGLQEWALEGEWNVHEEYVEAVTPGARLKYRYYGSSVDVFTSAPDISLSDMAVYIDGQFVPNSMWGKDLTIIAPPNNRTAFQFENYQERHSLIQSPLEEHVIEFEVKEAGVRLHSLIIEQKET